MFLTIQKRAQRVEDYVWRVSEGFKSCFFSKCYQSVSDCTCAVFSIAYPTLIMNTLHQQLRGSSLNSVHTIPSLSLSISKSFLIHQFFYTKQQITFPSQLFSPYEVLLYSDLWGAHRSLTPPLWWGVVSLEFRNLGVGSGM